MIPMSALPALTIVIRVCAVAAHTRIEGDSYIRNVVR